MALATRHPQPIVQQSPKSPIAEAYRTIRTNIQFARMVSDAKAIMITSSRPGEGKTSTASNLAIVTAQAGHRVLLIDADMRKPQIHQRFQVSNLDGLSNVLIRERSVKECIISSQTSNLFLLPSGPIPPNPSELLGSKGFMDLLGWAKSEFDLVYLDTHPSWPLQMPSYYHKQLTDSFSWLTRNTQKET